MEKGNKKSCLDINKVKVIIDVLHEALENRDNYRFACDLTGSELVELQKHFNFNVIEKFPTTTLYNVTKK